jgi:hypothetical protein
MQWARSDENKDIHFFNNFSKLTNVTQSIVFLMFWISYFKVSAAQ